MLARDVASVSFYIGTATVVALVTHALRQALAVRELRARVDLERERDRTRGLLARLDRLSHEDPLTGVANRRRWDAELDTACDRARAEGSAVAVLLVDLDHFKAVNDRHGHAGGDTALRAVAALLAGRVRGDDLVARLGGDELGVLMPGADADRAVGLAEGLRGATAQLQLPGFAAGELTLSLGVAVGTGPAAVPAELMTRADAGLYAAKSTRNAVGVLPGVPVPSSGGLAPH
nr:diguanylate cyclase [Geodermatophilus sabuli]